MYTCITMHKCRWVILWAAYARSLVVESKNIPKAVYGIIFEFEYWERGKDIMFF